MNETIGQIDYTKLAPLLKKKPAPRIIGEEQIKLALIFSRHRFYRHLVIEIVQVERTKNGKLKNPFIVLDPMDLMWKTENQLAIKFFAGLLRFKNQYEEGKPGSDIEALKAIISNPLQLEFFVHDEKVSPTVNAKSVTLAKFGFFKADVSLHIDERRDTFSINGFLKLSDKSYALQNLEFHFRYFLKLSGHYYLIDDLQLLHITDFFKQHQHNLVLERQEYEEFQQKILAGLEGTLKINYAYLKPATEKQRIEQGFDLENEQLIYLSESEDFVLITPVMRYGSLEIPVISQKQIQAKDKRGQFFTLHRDSEKELQFISTIAKSHPFFQEQVTEFPEQRHADCFYMHRKHFLEPSWFLDAFEAWRSKGIAILGFNALKDQPINQYKPEIGIEVISGIDWFETAIKVKFNHQYVSLKYLHKSIRNKNKFVQLDDGTLGLLPDEWLQKFEGYFSAGEIVNNSLRTPNINFNLVEALYEAEYLSIEALQRIKLYRQKLSLFESIDHVAVPKDLNTKLRIYQQEGLNWLNFLDDFNFGACLADDMGLGKTIQILAFILLQREKVKHNVNLVVVPASLIFNWQQEIKKFAPTLKLLTVYGADRTKNQVDFAGYDIVLTSYGIMLSEIKWLKDYHFNYIILDESQHIKNPSSQRNKAARLLRSRNKIVMTGTPIENNTFDLYGQFAFACPGLLGSKEEFRRLYAVPIDQFKDQQRAKELQKRINPFLLRRTKEQVAKELPDKTEMMIYCEMGNQQREIYDSCRNEIRDYILKLSEDELTKSSMHVLQGITKLRQICNSPAILSKEKDFGNASAKLNVLMEQIESKYPHHKILVFSQFVSMLDLIKAALESRQIPFSYLTGATKNREKVVGEFQQQATKRVFLISLKAGGVGLNLTQADYVYLIDPWWNPAVENQAIDRAHRIGQDQHVVAVRLICPDTIEEKILLMQDSKKMLSQNLIKTDESIFKTLSKKDLLELL